MATTVSPKPQIMPTSSFCLYFLCLWACFVLRPYFAFCMRGCLCAYLWEDWKLSLSISAAPLQIGLLKSFNFIRSSSAKAEKRPVVLPLQSPSVRGGGALGDCCPTNGDNEVKSGSCTVFEWPPLPCFHLNLRPVWLCWHYLRRH